MIPGNYIRAEAEDLNLNAAIDKTKNNIQRKLEKFQHIREAKFKRGARKTKSLKNLL
jgi:ribosome-associated translation inhibitor RaiA